MSGHGFPTIENCIKCVLRDHRLFCNLPNDALIALQAIKATAVYPKGSMLCLEGQPARGVFILCTGRAKLSTTSAEGKSIILRIADPGEVLGLSAVVSNGTYEATVETLEPTQANFISQAQFVQYLQQYPEVGMKVAQQLTHNCKCAYSEIRALGLSNSVPEKIAKLLLTWAKQPLNMPGIKNEIPIRVTLTQEEIAQFVGTSRESVSRTLSEFKKKGWLRTKGATWWIVEKQHLERLVTT